MAAYTVTAVDDSPRQWESQKGGPMLSYRVTLDGPDGQHVGVEWARKQSSPAPTVGQQVEGTIDTSGNYGPKFKQQAQAGGFGGGGRGRDPKERAEIRRQHAQTTALRYAELQHARGKLPDEFDISQLGQVIEWFYRDSGSATA